MNEVQNQKNLLRKTLRERCGHPEAGWRDEASEKICTHLMNANLWLNISEIGGFAADNGEPDLSKFFHWAKNNNKRLFLPRFNQLKGEYEMVEVHNLDTDMIEGKYHILEPSQNLSAATEKEYEKISYLIPGVGFDSTGNRLGRGKGYFDRLLSRGSGRRIGVFFQFQKLEAIPKESHDQTLDMAVTEEKILIFK